MTQRKQCSLFLVTWLAVALLAGCAHQPYNNIDVPALLNAIERDDVGGVRNVVEGTGLGPNVSVPAPGYSDGAPLLTLAAREASLDVMRYLLAGGADPNALTPVGETPLMLAAFFSEDYDRGGTSHERHDQAVLLLLKAGASIETGPYQYTPLSYAAYKGRKNIMQLLLSRGARVDGSAQNGTSYVNTPLMMAAIEGHYEAALMLLQAGADPRIRGYHGRTAAELAMRNKHWKLANVLQCAEQLPQYASFQASCGGRAS